MSAIGAFSYFVTEIRVVLLHIIKAIGNIHRDDETQAFLDSKVGLHLYQYNCIA